MLRRRQDPLNAARITEVATRVDDLERQMRNVLADLPELAQIARRHAKLDDRVEIIRARAVDDVARLDAAVVQLRGQINGGKAGRKGQQSELLEVGRQVTEAIALARTGDTTQLRGILDELLPLANDRDDKGGAVLGE